MISDDLADDDEIESKIQQLEAMDLDAGVKRELLKKFLRDAGMQEESVENTANEAKFS